MGLSPDEVDFLNLCNPSSHTMALGSTQPLTEISIRNLPGGWGLTGSRCIRLTNLPLPVSRLFRKCGCLDLLQPHGPPRPVTGIALPYLSSPSAKSLQRHEIDWVWIHTAELLVPDPRPFEVEIAIENLEMYKSPGSNGILAEGDILRSKIHKLIKSIWNKEELPDQWKESIIVPVHKKGDKTECSNYHCYQLHTKFYPIFFTQG
jgi:hypothetical protein